MIKNTFSKYIDILQGDITSALEKVDELGKKFDLSEEQRIELLKSVMRNFNSINSNDKDADDDNVHHHRDGIEDNDGDGAASKIASSAELELEN